MSVITKAYHKIAQKKHPDKSKEDPATATKKFQKISVAYETLKDEQTRAKYDIALERKKEVSSMHQARAQAPFDETLNRSEEEELTRARWKAEDKVYKAKAKLIYELKKEEEKEELKARAQARAQAWAEAQVTTKVKKPHKMRRTHKMRKGERQFQRAEMIPTKLDKKECPKKKGRSALKKEALERKRREKAKECAEYEERMSNLMEYCQWHFSRPRIT